MKGKKRTFLFLIGIMLILLVSGWLYIGSSSSPHVSISRSVIDSDERFPEEEYYYERIMTTISLREGTSMPEKLDEELHKLLDWCNSIDADLHDNYVAPMHITVDGKVEGGKTTFWYKGQAANRDGETVEYYEEKTFDYVFAPGTKLFQ